MSWKRLRAAASSDAAGGGAESAETEEKVDDGIEPIMSEDEDEIKCE